jgi:alpha-D-xyloside xylohydrolase
VFDGAVPDFADPAARQIFGDYHKQQLVDLGISGFKLDECDNSDFVGGWSFPELSRFPSGLDGEQMHSVFGLRYQDAVLSAFAKAQKPTYGLVRSSGSLAAPYPFVLYSDLYNHRDFVRALVNSGFSGLLWCPEVRDAASSEDLLRRLQTVVFSPLAMINAWYIANPPWMQQDRDKNNRNEFAPGWQQMEEQCREIIGWRMQLVPYLKAAFERYSKDGTPPFRALAMDYPDDPGMANVDDSYLVGDRMLVAPVFAGETNRRIALPHGRWCDFWTGETVEGGAVLSVETRLDRIPVYVKSGSVFPIGGIAGSTQDPATRQIVARVYGDGSLPFVLGGKATPAQLRLEYDASSGSDSQSSSTARGYSIERWQLMRG